MKGGNNLLELDRLENWNNEAELVQILEKVEDKINFQQYQEEQVLRIVKKLLKINILSLGYTAREELLNVLCDSVEYYNIRSKINWETIKLIREKVEKGLVEYIDEILNVTQ